MIKAIILAAGSGNRCKPLTEHVPKCLLEFAGSTLLEHQKHALEHNNITDLTVVCGYKHDLVQQQAYQCVVNSDYENSNMVYSLFKADHLFSGQFDLVVAYGDIIYQTSNLQKLLQTNGDVVVMSDLDWYSYWSMRFEDVYSDAETFVVNEQREVTALGGRIVDRNSVQGQFTGLIKLSAAITKEMAEVYQDLLRQHNHSPKIMNMYMTDFIQYLIDIGWQVRAAEVSRGWLEFDTAKDMYLYQQMLEKNTLGQHYQINL